MDGPTSTENSRLAGFFVAGTRLILANAWATIIVAVGLAVVASFYSAMRLGYQTSRLDLVNPNSEYNRHWEAYAREFGDKDDAVIVIEGRGRERIAPVIDDLTIALAREQQQLEAVFARVDMTTLRGKGLYFLSLPQLQAIQRRVEDAGPILAGDWGRLNAGRTASAALASAETAVRQASRRDAARPGGVRQASGAAAVPGAENPLAALAPLERYLDSLAGALERRPFASPWIAPEAPLAQTGQLASQYMLSPDERFGFITLKLATGADVFNKTAESGDLLRRIVAQARERFPNVKIGLTGLPIMEDDEMHASQASMLLASIISMIGVGVLFVAGFGGIRHALLANGILIIGMAWSFAYATATVGHLNILSVTFTATLIGIGIDYGVYYCARYLQLRKECDTCEAALLETSRSAGPAIVTGAVTTSISFFAAGCTTFVGVAELGVIAGGGILLCALAELTVLPASIYLIDRSNLGRRMPEPLAVHKWIQPMLRVPRLTMLAGAALTIVLASGLGRLWYDNNLLNMQAEGLESVELERRLLDECHQSSWYAISIADTPDQLLALKASYQRLPSVERTEEIVSLIPNDIAAKRPLIEWIGRRLEKIADHVPLIPVERPERLSQTLDRLSRILALAGPDTPCLGQIQRIRAQLDRGAAADSYALLSRFQQQAGDLLLAQLRELREVADPRPPSLSDLPPGLRQRFVGRHGKHLLRIYGRGNLWDTQALTRFVHETRRIDPRITGNPVQAHEASLEMRRSYQDAALYSLLVIIGVLWLDFRNVRHALLAALPLGVGVLEAFGMMGWLQIPVNPANLIALPLILGIGVDYGVHIMHEFREQHGPYRMSPGTAVAVLVDAATTIMGYGALMVASHQGLQSLGRVLTLAVTCCLFTSIVLLPALLTWTTRRRPAAAASEAETPPNAAKSAVAAA